MSIVWKNVKCLKKLMALTCTVAFAFNLDPLCVLTYVLRTYLKSVVGHGNLRKKW